MSNEPEPFVPPDTDLSALPWLPLNVDHLLASELLAIATPEEFKAALMLWCRAWKQVPAGSLPNDERVLASFSGAQKRWCRVRNIALRGFVLCSDGRLYHRFLCDEVLRTHARREANRKRLETWRAKQNETRSERVQKRSRNGTGNSDVTPAVALDRDRDRDRDRGKKEPVGSSFPQNVPKDADASFSLTAGAARMHEFAQWWQAYPRKVGKGRAQRCYAAARKAGATAEELLSAAERYAAAAIDAEPQFVAHPATWLGQGRWQDEDVGIAPRQRTPAENMFLGAMRAADEFTERQRQEQSRNNGADRGPPHPLLDRR